VQSPRSHTTPITSSSSRLRGGSFPRSLAMLLGFQSLVGLSSHIDVNYDGRQNDPPVKPASSRHRAGIKPASSPHQAGIESASNRHRVRIKPASSPHPARIGRASGPGPSGPLKDGPGRRYHSFPGAGTFAPCRPGAGKGRRSLRSPLSFRAGPARALQGGRRKEYPMPDADRESVPASAPRPPDGRSPPSTLSAGAASPSGSSSSCRRPRASLWSGSRGR